MVLWAGERCNHGYCNYASSLKYDRPSFIRVHLWLKKCDRPLRQKVRSPILIPNQKSPDSKDEPENPQAAARESAPP